MATIDRFNKHSVQSLDVSQFENLPLKTKKLVYHLSRAGLFGRDIFFDQNYKDNLSIKSFLELIY